jgi:hypothetical protein
MWAIYARAIYRRGFDMKKIRFEDSIFYGVPGWSEAVISPDYSKEELQDEKFLSETITELWTTRQHYSTEVKYERQCIRGLDSRLGQMFFQLKSILAKPGRNGGWSSWLAERNISRATADRLVVRFARSRGLYNRLPHEASPEPTELQIKALCANIWPRCEKTLTTPQSRYAFLQCFLYRSGLAHDLHEHGTFLYEPGHEPAQGSSGNDDETTSHGLAGDGDVL